MEADRGAWSKAGTTRATGDGVGSSDATIGITVTKVPRLTVERSGGDTARDMEGFVKSSSLVTSGGLLVSPSGVELEGTGSGGAGCVGD